MPANLYVAPSSGSVADASGPQVPSSGSPPGWSERGGAPLYPEERIDIPGTHVPAWVVVVLVVGVVALLSGTAFLLLR
jgi:hypothetical protein